MAVILKIILLISSTKIISSYKIQCGLTVPESGDLESPQWSEQENALYFVNNFGQKLFRMDGNTGKVTTRDVCLGPTFFIVPVRDYPGYVVVAIRSSVYLFRWGASGGDSAFRLLTTVDHGKPDNNINDGKADAAGRLWFGTFGKLNFSLPTMVPLDQGTLYSMDTCNYADPAIKKRPVSFSNGITWSLDNKKLYYNDSPTRRVVSFDYDLKTGAIANETVIFRFADYNISGVPDGMTKDRNGNLWIGTFSKTILHVNPRTRKLIKQINLPVDRASSVMWGGRRLDILFVTTSNLNISKPRPLSGSLCKITSLETCGVPENQFVFPGAPNY